MRIGITLPQFREDPSDALAAARVADADPRIEGVFVFDHLWAIGQPDRPALSAWPLLGALASVTERVVLGTLVARVSLLPDAVLEHHVATMLSMVGPHRFVAGLGAGDSLSKAENEAYGIPFPPVDERLAVLDDCTARCLAAGATVWVGGLSSKVAAIARERGVALNVWGVDPARVAADAADGEVTWGGVAADVGTLAPFLAELRAAGATWAVVAPDYKKNAAPEAAIKTISEAAAAA